MAAVMLFLLGKDRKTEHNTHFCMPLKPVFTKGCGNGVHFMDEPMNGLDRKSVELVRNLIKKTADAGAVVLLSSHNQEDIDTLCDVVYHMEDGRIVA